jgi:hypothetical protein
MLSSFHAFTENLFFGIQAPSVSTVGIIFSIGLRYGILALMCLILLLIIRLSHLTAYTPYIRSSTVRPYVRMVSLGFVALISFGIFVDLFAGVESFFFFFSVYGLCSATLRISKKETDDRLSYYGDSRSSESSVIEVSVRK